MPQVRNTSRRRQAAATENEDTGNEDSESSEPLEPKVLPERVTRGQRLTELDAEAAILDKEFWTHETWKEEAEDEEWSTEDERHYKDEIDSDFGQSDSEAEAEEEAVEQAAAEAAEKVLQRQEKRHSKNSKFAYQEPRSGLKIAKKERRKPLPKKSDPNRPRPPSPARPRAEIKGSHPAKMAKRARMFCQEDLLEQAAKVEEENTAHLHALAVQENFKKAVKEQKSSKFVGEMEVIMSWSSDRVAEGEEPPAESAETFAKELLFFVNFTTPQASRIPPILRQPKIEPFYIVDEPSLSDLQSTPTVPAGPAGSAGSAGPAASHERTDKSSAGIFNKVTKGGMPKCAVYPSLDGRYRDPVTGEYYSSTRAFARLRRKFYRDTSSRLASKMRRLDHKLRNVLHFLSVHCPNWTDNVLFDLIEVPNVSGSLNMSSGTFTPGTVSPTSFLAETGPGSAADGTPATSDDEFAEKQATEQRGSYLMLPTEQSRAYLASSSTSDTFMNDAKDRSPGKSVSYDADRHKVSTHGDTKVSRQKRNFSFNNLGTTYRTTQDAFSQSADVSGSARVTVNASNNVNQPRSAAARPRGSSFTASAEKLQAQAAAALHQVQQSVSHSAATQQAQQLLSQFVPAMYVPPTAEAAFYGYPYDGGLAMAAAAAALFQYPPHLRAFSSFLPPGSSAGGQSFDPSLGAYCFPGAPGAPSPAYLQETNPFSYYATAPYAGHVGTGAAGVSPGSNVSGTQINPSNGTPYGFSNFPGPSSDNLNYEHPTNTTESGSQLPQYTRDAHPKPSQFNAAPSSIVPQDPREDSGET